jgi:hypothetical protein
MQKVPPSSTTSTAIVGAEVDWAPLLRLHRHADGYLSFAVAQEEDWRPIFAIRADRLERMFPEIRDYLLRDSFVSINAAHRASPRSKSSVLMSSALGGIPRPQHRSETLRYLCACYCDLDFYKKGLAYPQALAALRNFVAEGQLPPFSFLVNSGRGVWAFWLLHDEADPEHAHTGAYADNPGNHLLLYQRIHREIGKRLAGVGADPAATDASRYVRMPGSFRNDVEAVVLWEWPDGAPMASYSLREMGRLLGLEQPVARPSAAGALPTGICPARRRGFDAANHNKLAAVEHLRALRSGGFAEGHRNLAAFILAACLRRTGATAAVTLVQVEALARACRPALPHGECLAVVRSVYKGRSRKMSYRYIADQLAVTPAEALSISETLRKPFPAAREDRASAAGNIPAGPRATRCLLRRLFIRNLVEELGMVPSSRRLQLLLRSSGMEAGHVTLLADLRALGFSAQRSLGIAVLSPCLEHAPSIA